jgi:predicted RNA-binding protein
MTSKNEIRLDWHYAEDATPAFVGIFITTKDAYEKGELPDSEDVVQIEIERNGIDDADILEDAAKMACDAANKLMTSSAGKALAEAANFLNDHEMVKNYQVSRMADSLSLESWNRSHYQSPETIGQHKAIQRIASDLSIRLKFPEQFVGEKGIAMVPWNAAALMRQMAAQLWESKVVGKQTEKLELATA